MNKINLGTQETFHCRRKDEYSFHTKNICRTLLTYFNTSSTVLKNPDINTIRRKQRLQNHITQKTGLMVQQIEVRNQ